MNYVDLFIGIIVVLLAIAMFWASVKEVNWELGLCFLLVSVLTLDSGAEKITKAYNKINPPCELAQGCEKKEVSV